MMKVGFIACARIQSGIADYTRDLREALHAHEDISTFLVSGRCFCPRSISHGNYDCVAFHDSRFERYILGGMQRAALRMVQQFKPRLLYRGLEYRRSMLRYQPDIVHYQMDREIFGVTPLRVLSRKRNFALVATLHEFEFTVNERLYARAFRELDRIIVHSEYSKRKVLNYLDDAGKVVLIPHGTWCDEKPEGERDQIAIFGIHSRFKRYDYVMDAADMVKNRFKKNAAVHFYGYMDGSVMKHYRNILKKRHLEDVIVFHGPLSEEAFHERLRRSRFIITPYEDSHASGIILKAMGHGTPVLSSRVGSIPEYLGEGGAFFSLDDPATLAEKILIFIEDEDARQAEGRRLWEKARKEYSWDLIAEKTIRVYLEIVGKTH